MAARETKSSNELAEHRTALATGRTLMAMERSLMAWIRTALSMISFGFTLYKVLQSFQEGGGHHLAHARDPGEVGLFLTGMGTMSMVMGTIEYWQRLKMLREYYPIRLWRPTFIIALIMSFIGLLVFVSIIANLA